MSVYIDKKDGEVTGIHIFGDDIKLFAKSLDTIMSNLKREDIDLWKFRDDISNKALFLILKEI